MFSHLHFLSWITFIWTTSLLFTGNGQDDLLVYVFVLTLVIVITGKVSCQSSIPHDGCPLEGIHHYPHDTDCEKYYLCVNGTGSLQTCPNGLLYQEHGAVYEFCAYYWNVPCPEGKTAPGPVSSPGCPWQFGIFPDEGSGECSPYYAECAWGVPERKPCHPSGLVYDDRIHGCNWPDQMGCSGEHVLGVRCPKEDKYNRFYPYPRYYYNEKAIVTCVNDQPRLIHCPEGHAADPNSLTCLCVVEGGCDEDKKHHN